MNKIYLLFFAVILLCQCKDNEANKAPAAPTKAKKLNLQLRSAISPDYDKLVDADLAISPVGRLCAESKGYVVDEWDAQNECSWAVEKYQIDSYPDLVSRKDSALQIKMSDKILTLTHNLTAPKKYYQFIDYLPNSKYFVIRVVQQNSCPEYWLIHATDGQKVVLPGRPVFTGSRDAFLLSTAIKKEALNCPKKLVLWSLQSNTFQQMAALETEAVVQNLFWKEGKTWLGKQGEKVLEISY